MLANLSARGSCSYRVITTADTFSFSRLSSSISRITSRSYVKPKSARILLFSMAFALIVSIISMSSDKVCSNLTLLSGRYPGSTLLACKSSNILPPNSIYSLPNSCMRDIIFSFCTFRNLSESNPFILVMFI